MSWSQKKSKLSGNVIIDGTIEGDQLADDTVSASKLEESYLRNDQNDSTDYRITAGALTVDTDTLYVDSSNNRVGVGTNMAMTQMHIKSGSSGVSALSNTKLFVDSSSSSDIQIGCGYYSTAGIKFGAYNDPDAGRVDYSTYFNALQFYTSGTQKATISSAGNLGVGTTYPSAKLHAMQGTGSGTNPVNSAVAFIDSNTSAFLQFGTGNYNTGGIYWGKSTDNDRGSIIYIGYSNSMQFRTNGTTKIHVTSAGNVGIGTTAPTGKLDVNDNSIRIRSSLTPSSNGSGQKGEICYDTNYMYVCVATNTWKRVALASW